MGLWEVLGSSPNGDKNGKKKKKLPIKKITILKVFEIMLYSICIASIAHNWKLVQNGSTKSLDVYIYKQIHVGT